MVTVFDEIESRWYFSDEKLQNSPSRQSGIDADAEMALRQSAACLINDIATQLALPHVIKLHAIVYMQRFYGFHSFAVFSGNRMAPACLFLAAKTHSDRRSLHQVIVAAGKCLKQPVADTTSLFYLKNEHDILFYENVILQTLGFNLYVDWPHVHILRACDMIRASNSIRKEAYYLASKCLVVTNMFVHYKPKLIACFCVELIARWAGWTIPPSTTNKYWSYYVDKEITESLLEKLMYEFSETLKKTAACIKRSVQLENVDLDVIIARKHNKIAFPKPETAEPEAKEELAQALNKSVAVTVGSDQLTQLF